MAAVTGPISTLPGAVHALPAGVMCDNHPDRPAFRRVQGETDSMGSELHDMCHACWDEHRAVMSKEDTSGECDWCLQTVSQLHNHRDFEEGSCGRVYRVCGPCIDNETERLREEEFEQYQSLCYDTDDYEDYGDTWQDELLEA